MRSPSAYYLHREAEAMLGQIFDEGLANGWTPGPIIRALGRTIEYLAEYPISGTDLGYRVPGLRVRAGIKPAHKYLILFEDNSTLERIEVYEIVHSATNWMETLPERFGRKS